MRTCRALLLLGVTLLLPAAAGAAPAHAGGGAGLTLAAAIDGQDRALLVGTRHMVWISVTDAPGEASLRRVFVSVVDPDPTGYPVTCDAKAPNGEMTLEVGQSLHCTTVVTALPGLRTVMVRARAFVPGNLTPLARSRPLHYTGVLPPPPPKHTAMLPPPPGESFTGEKTSLEHEPQKSPSSSPSGAVPSPPPTSPTSPTGPAHPPLPGHAVTASPVPVAAADVVVPQRRHSGLAFTGTTVPLIGLGALGIAGLGAVLVAKARRGRMEHQQEQ